MRITKKQLRRIIREAFIGEADEQTFTGTEGRWEVAWSPMGDTWELQADGVTVAKGPAEAAGAGAKFMGEKGTDIIAAITAYRKANSDYWEFENRPKETTFPENEKEGWSIEFSDEEEGDNMDVEEAFDNATQAMRDAWG